MQGEGGTGAYLRCPRVAPSFRPAQRQRLEESVPKGKVTLKNPRESIRDGKQKERALARIAE